MRHFVFTKMILLCAMMAGLCTLACRQEQGSLFQSCLDDTDCTSVESCVNEICRQMCVISIDCGMDQYCYEGSCYYNDSEKPYDSLQCIDYLDCRSSQVCIDSVCHDGCLDNKHCEKGMYCTEDPDHELGQCSECISDDHCMIHHLCRDNSCLQKCWVDAHCGNSAYGPNCDYDTGYCQECVNGADCKTDEKCEENVCVQIDHRCKSSDDCSVEMPFCQLNLGKCVQCLEKSDCNAGFYCIDNVCEHKCKTDDDCFGERFCLSNGIGFGECVDCIKDEHCADNFHCFNGACYRTECESDLNCSYYGFCHPFEKMCYSFESGACKDNWDCPNARIVCDPYTHQRCMRSCTRGCLYSEEPYCDDTIPFPACYECLEDSHCDTRCDRMNNTCVKCSNEEPCAKAGLHCNVDNGECLACLDDSYCKNGYRCSETDMGVQCVACIEHSDCTTTELPACNIYDNTCVECTNDSHCKEAGLLACNTYNNTCVECTNDDHCTDDLKPNCGEEQHCIDKCEDQCVLDEIKCIPSMPGESYYFYICGDYDNDRCTEWSTGQYRCPYGQNCFSGECKCLNECEPDVVKCDPADNTSLLTCIRYDGCYKTSRYQCLDGELCIDDECQIPTDGDAESAENME